MSSANFTILRQCENCSKMFEAQKRTTRFCTHKCSSQNYKLRKRLDTKKQVEKESIRRIAPKVRTINIELIKHKEYLRVVEVATLFGCSKNTIYRMIQSGELNAVNLLKHLTRIKRTDIEKLFEQPIPVKPDILTIENCYTMAELCQKYNVATNTIYGYVGKHNIERIKKNGITYYSKYCIDNLFKSI